MILKTKKITRFFVNSQFEPLARKKNNGDSWTNAFKECKATQNSLYDKSNDTDHAKQLIYDNNMGTYIHFFVQKELFEKDKK